MIADYDRDGRRIPYTMSYQVNRFPVARTVIENHEIALVNVSDPRADAAETALMRRDGDKSLLVLPMLYQGDAIGLVEAVDHVRERRFTRQELRLATALAGQSAVALHNAKIFAHLTRADRDVRALRQAIETIGASIHPLVSPTDATELLQATVEVARDSLGATSSVADCYGRSARSSTGDPATGARAGTAPADDHTHTIVASAPCNGDRLSLTVTLPEEPGEGPAELLALIANAAAAGLARLA